MNTENNSYHSSKASRGLKLLGKGFIVGVGIGLVLRYTQISNLALPLQAILSSIWGVASKVGITIVVLIPLAIWAIRAWRSDMEHKNKAYHLLWIGSQAKEVGFIGTLIGVMLMFAALGVSLQQGDSGSIRGAIGGFSQAVISSLIGYIISVTCKWLHFIETRKEVEHA